MIRQIAAKHNRKREKFLRIGFIMDPMSQLDLPYDNSTRLMFEAQTRGHRIFYIEPNEVFARDGEVYANVREVSVSNRPVRFRIISKQKINLNTLSAILIRKEPPFDISYLYLMQMLELIKPKTVIMNSPAGLRKANEKLYILHFPKWIPPTLVTNRHERILEFLGQIKDDLILKPLDQKGGAGIQLLPFGSKRSGQTAKRMTGNGSKWIMAQKFIKRGRTQGDKRILLLDGQVIGVFRRIPKHGEFRANLSLGGHSTKARLTRRDRLIIRSLIPRLKQDGLCFTGIDVVDGYLIEINVTSPAGFTEISASGGKRPEARFVDFLESRVLKR